MLFGYCLLFILLGVDWADCGFGFVSLSGVCGLRVVCFCSVLVVGLLTGVG